MKESPLAAIVLATTPKSPAIQVLRMDVFRWSMEGAGALMRRIS
jgi:hypothetical protein